MRHTSCGGWHEMVEAGSRGVSVRHRIVDFQPPAQAVIRRQVALRGTQLSEMSDPPGEFCDRWARIDTGNSTEVVSLELLPRPGDSDVREGFWIFCGRHFARVVGPPRGLGLVAGTCCSSLDQLQRIHGAEGAGAELQYRYEAVYGMVETPGVLRIHRQAWYRGRQGHLFYDRNTGIGGEIVVLRNEGVIVHHRSDNAGQETWRIRDWTFNPFAPDTADKAEEGNVANKKDPEKKEEKKNE